MALPLTPHPDYPFPPVPVPRIHSAYAAALPVILLTPPEHPNSIKHPHPSPTDYPYPTMHDGPPPPSSGNNGRHPPYLQVPAAVQRPSQSGGAGSNDPLMAYRGPHPAHPASSFNSPVSPPSHPPAYPQPQADSPLAPHDPYTQQRVHAVTSRMQQMAVSHPNYTDPRRLAEYAASSKPTFWDSPYPEKTGKGHDNTSLAVQTCAMMCYIWYSDAIGPHSIAGAEQALPRDEIQVVEEDARSRLQFMPTRDFITFMQGVLSTTALSRSVVVLALMYVYRLKQMSPVLALKGSETRLAITALMMANKFVDDNTYTNKTWSDVSHIPLEEINTSEAEFLAGISFKLHVSGAMYDAWLKLLKGLAIAKEEEQASFLRRRSVLRHHRRNTQPARARSTSPLASRTIYYANPNPPSNSQGYLPDAFSAPSVSSSPSPPQPRSMPKRRVEDAFSPESVHGSVLPPRKRADTQHSSAARFDPPVDLPHLVIPSRPSSSKSAPGYPAQQASSLSSAQRPHTAEFTYSVPLQPVPPAIPQPVPARPQARHLVPPPNRPPSTVDTLAAPYALHNRLPNFNEPHDLYYFTIAASPLDVADPHRPYRKSVLRYTHPSYFANNPSSSSSQRPILPPPQQLPSLAETDSVVLPPLQNVPPDPTAPVGGGRRRRSIFSRANAQIAPFANAGSPGVQWTGERFPWGGEQVEEEEEEERQ